MEPGIVIDLSSPTYVRLVGLEEHPELLDGLSKELQYVDGRVDYELQQHRRNRRWYVGRYGEAVWDDREQELLDKREKCLLDRDEVGYRVPSGLAARVSRFLGVPVHHTGVLPERNLVPWERVPEHATRSYQKEAFEKLIAARHAGVEHCTGAGKSRVVLELAKYWGLRTVVIAPSKSIAGQLYADFVRHLGKKHVGMYGDGKKQLGKLFTIAIGASLTRVEGGTPAWDFFSAASVVIADESHLVPCATLEKVMYGVLANAPIRYFFSATQMRNDGLDMVLEGITGPIVHTLTVQECVEMGYLARPKFTVLRLDSGSEKDIDDPNDMTREHLYYSRHVNRVAGDLANRFVSHLKRPTVILIDEVEQFSHLLPHLKHLVQFAHGPLGENKSKVPAAYHVVDNDKLVAQFNAGEIPILVGTSCITTGTDLKVAEAVIYLQGGKSPIQVKQALGRGTRGGINGTVVNPWTGKKKVDCHVVDFAPMVYGSDQGNKIKRNNSAPYRHALERVAIYEEVYPPVTIRDVAVRSNTDDAEQGW